MTRARPTEAWILAGTIDGRTAMPEPSTRVSGLPQLQRIACTLAAANTERITVVWAGERDAPDIAALSAHPMLEGRAVNVSATVPAGDSDEPVLVVRGDRIYHRELPKMIAAAAEHTTRPLVKIAGDDYDAVLIAPRHIARKLAGAAANPGALAEAVTAATQRGEVEEIAPPWLGFTVAAPDRKSLVRAEGLLVRSLRKTADGYMSRLLNRRISLLLSRYLCKTPVQPNQITVVCFALALCGGLTIARGGYLAGVVGLLLVELGSIVDGVDGELSRLKYSYSRVGQWMDTVTDDLSNVFLVSGITISLHNAGVHWALPVGLVGLGAFFLTQLTQYYFIAVVYKSGDLAAIPWAFQSTESLSARPKNLVPRIKAAIPRLLKRDVTLTFFVVMAFAGRIDVVLAAFTAGAVAFLFSFSMQLVRHLAAGAEES